MCRIDLSISPNDVLIVVGGALAMEEKKTSKIAKIGADLGDERHNRQRYMNCEVTSGFTSSNTSIYTP